MKRMSDRRPLAAGHVLLLIRAGVLIVVTRVALALFPFRWVQRLLDRPVGESPFRPTEAAHYRRTAVWAVEAVGRRLLGDKPCLVQALVARRLLARRGIPATLRIGVARSDSGALLAHAWLEHEGEIIIGGRTASARYAAFPPVS